MGLNMRIKRKKSTNLNHTFKIKYNEKRVMFMNYIQKQSCIHFLRSREHFYRQAGKCNYAYRA